ncbi:endonuclease/exonuclease/phosphatase family protein [Micromonospora sp. WMMD710]|uniref:endonuclease/exonuclease/phosphatase family protein n=1 Tax=Micromonospora sp. WMMD710 TaxID=3016085 RepID=UPI0024168155|nr:endonuclease/exonuclease/phosphatase family protein [Micromonospora sp. WMMD710]MDG4760426.1 endonuclease/exonuclease/phosphatase family protein [Micromonospora sp. WMMD710]
MLSILTINVQAAALTRAQNLLTWLLQRDDHLIILTETSNGPGTRHLLTGLRAARMFVTHQPSLDGDRGCAIASRIPTRPAPDLTAGISLPGRAPAVTLDTHPDVTILGLYVPSSDRAPAKLAKKRAFLTTVTDALTQLSADDRAHLVVGGDYNVISRDHQPRYPGFRPFEYEFLDALTALGLADIHRTLHPEVQAHSWIGRAGNGYRFDYLHAGPGLLPHLVAAAYLNQPRLEGLTDHCAHSADIDTPPAGGRGAGTRNTEAPLTSRTYSQTSGRIGG